MKPTHRALNPSRLRPPPGPWSNAIEVRPGARYLFTCGLVGVRHDGTFEKGIEAQAVRIFENLQILLAEAGMDMNDVVKRAPGDDPTRRGAPFKSGSAAGSGSHCREA